MVMRREMWYNEGAKEHNRIPLDPQEGGVSMQKDYGTLDRYSEELQNIGLRSAEHDRLDKLPRQDRMLFGLNDEVLRRREALGRLLDENGLPEDGEN